MPKKTLIWLQIIVGVFCSCSNPKTSIQLVLPSPDSRTHIYFNLNEGEPYYLVYHNGKKIIEWSLLGLKLQNKFDFSEGLTLLKTESFSFNSHEPLELAGGYSFIQDYNELKLFMSKSSLPGHSFQIVLRAYNSGIGIMYFLPETSGDSSMVLFEDKTQIALAGLDDLWTKIETVDTMDAINHKFARESIAIPAVLRSKEGMELIITEAASLVVMGSVLEKLSDSNTDYQFKPYMTDFFTFGRINGRFVTPMRAIIFNDLTRQSSIK